MFATIGRIMLLLSVFLVGLRGSASAEGCIVQWVTTTNVPGGSYPFGDVCTNPSRECWNVYHNLCPGCYAEICALSESYTIVEAVCHWSASGGNLQCSDSWSGLGTIQGTGTHKKALVCQVTACLTCPNYQQFFDAIKTGFENGSAVTHERYSFTCNCESDSCT